MELLKKLMPKHTLTDKVAFIVTHVGLVGIILIRNISCIAKIS